MKTAALDRIARTAMADPDFRDHLKRDPAGAAAAAGIPLSDDELKEIEPPKLDQLSEPEVSHRLAAFVFKP